MANYLLPNENIKSIEDQRYLFAVRNEMIDIVKTPTPTQHNTTVGFDDKMTAQTIPHTNFSATSRQAREMKFGTHIH